MTVSSLTLPQQLAMMRTGMKPNAAIVATMLIPGHIHCAGERERLAGERLQAANSRAASASTALKAVQTEAGEATRSWQSEYKLRLEAASQCHRLEGDLHQVRLAFHGCMHCRMDDWHIRVA